MLNSLPLTLLLLVILFTIITQRLLLPDDGHSAGHKVSLMRNKTKPVGGKPPQRSGFSSMLPNFGRDGNSEAAEDIHDLSISEPDQVEHARSHLMPENFNLLPDHVDLPPVIQKAIHEPGAVVHDVMSSIQHGVVGIETSLQHGFEGFQHSIEGIHMPEMHMPHMPANMSELGHQGYSYLSGIASSFTGRGQGHRGTDRLRGHKRAVHHIQDAQEAVAKGTAPVVISNKESSPMAPAASTVNLAPPMTKPAVTTNVITQDKTQQRPIPSIQHSQAVKSAKQAFSDLLKEKGINNMYSPEAVAARLQSLDKSKPKPKMKSKPSASAKAGAKAGAKGLAKGAPKLPTPLFEDPVSYHEQISPRKGSDISEPNQLSILKCPNQTACIVPELQLKIKLRIYLCKHPVRQGIRFYFLTREGFMLHPNVILVDEADMSTADFIVYLPGSAPWHKTECTNTSFAKKLIVMDEFDGHTIFWPTGTPKELKATYGPKMIWYFMYFKRSFVARMDGKFLRFPHIDSHDVYPLTYSIAEAYVSNKFQFVRELEILCTLRGSKHMTTRLRAQTWVAEYALQRNISSYIAGQVNTQTRSSVSKMYFEHMYNAKIIVTVNPANWEGDFRLWEAMASGALIFVDHIFVPHPFPLRDKEHVVFYDNNNQTELFEKLDYYRANPKEARRIAVNGYLHAMKYHRTVSMVDYVLRSAHLKRAHMKNMPTMPDYVYTGQYLNTHTRQFREEIAEKQRPAHYKPIVMKNHTHAATTIH